MAELTTSYRFSELYTDVAEYAGVGRSPTVADIALAKRRVNDAYRKFIMANPHTWSFLKPTKVLPLESGKWYYDLPDNFGGMIMPFKYPTDDAGYNISEISYEQLMDLRTGVGTTSGRPILWAIRNKEYSEGEGTRYEVCFFYTPNGTYELIYSYIIGVNKLVNDDDIAIGQPTHSATLRAFCLAEVELFEDEGEKNAHTKALYGVPYLGQRGLLQQSLDMDKKMKPRFIGMLNEFRLDDRFLFRKWNASELEYNQ